MAEFEALENFAVYVKDTHCKHLLFGCCHDNGYVPTLDSWKNDATVASRISLVRPYRLGEGYKKLPFDVAHFNGVFRDAELLTYKDFHSIPTQASNVQFSMPTRTNSYARRLSTPGREVPNSNESTVQPQQPIPAVGVKRTRTPSNDILGTQPALNQPQPWQVREKNGVAVAQMHKNVKPTSGILTPPHLFTGDGLQYEERCVSLILLIAYLKHTLTCKA